MPAYLKKEKFEEILTRKNISQDDFAKMLDISGEHLSRLKVPEKYDSSPSPELREKMLKILSVEFDDIFFVQDYRFNGNNSLDTTAK